MQRDSHDSVEAINEVVTQIEQESDSIYTAGETFKEISGLVDAMNGQIQTVVGTMLEIAESSQQVLATTNSTVEELQTSSS